jgi:hypothetical protein
MSDPIKLSDLPVEVVIKALKEEIKNNKPHDKSNVATLVLVSIYNVLVEAYTEAIK